MRTGHLLLVAIAFLVLSADMSVKVSARCPDPVAVYLNPGQPCDPQTCNGDCAREYHEGIGVCLNPKTCYCEYCLD
ncbi:hypothetical protein HU200_002246 [Digitaria exilis]|uniref:Defensin n=1 Tax=Digitaria exilis TaxID=1010633 RepID=A0A835FW58_9POAL|nr:hypothetical protein HU200_002246 [Digitaria exilis]